MNEDLISREAVLSRLNEIKNEKVSRNGELPKIDRAIKCVEELPTIPTDGDFISRKSVIQLTREMISAEEYGLMDLLDEIKKLPTIPQTDLTYDMVEQYAKENGFVIWTKEQTEDTLRKLLNYMDTEKQTEDIKAEIEKLPRIKVGNSNSPEVKYCIDERLIYEVFDKHISRKE